MPGDDDSFAIWSGQFCLTFSSSKAVLGVLGQRKGSMLQMLLSCYLALGHVVQAK